MDEMLVNMRNIRFMLYEVLDVESLCRFPYYADHSKETFDLALETADQMAREVFWPAFQVMDQEGARFDGRQVSAPPAMHAIWRQFRDGGWFAPDVAYEKGGQQFPLTLYAAAFLLFNSGNTSACMYLGGASGAGRLIENHGSEQLKDWFLLKLYSGEWGGTMALTEPDAGTSLGDITTTARKAPEGDYYLIKGIKRFISSGDHDLAENIVHPVLARIEGAPPGIKGISLFIVPKYRVNPDGTPGDFNDVAATGLEHKMGLKGQATATLAFGDKNDCRGWLLGEPNKGLSYMFELMNTARVFTGIQAVGQASAAYHCALRYANERLQGREITSKDPTTPPIAIINHPDVRLMLLRQKAFVEGCIGLILYCANKADIRKVTQDPEEYRRVDLLLELLTPCCKAHGADGAFDSIRTAMQCFGGVGYSEEFPIAQMLRDNKVFSIYEGANGIQALDLLGRKVPLQAGEAVRILMGEMAETIQEADALDPLKDIAAKVRETQDAVIAVTMQLAGIGMSGDIPLYVCNASDYLEMFSRLAVGWQLLMQAVVAQKALDAGAQEQAFYQGKIATARFYANRVLPHAVTTANILKANERTALDFDPAWF
ncbi:MAG TPA: acyl-CoA dehydrogenase [Candidatus Hydrogenedentes bacterium]|nr:acyl-CoA dehydrogenase [Candidatus Hydrogenedentota bacterium]HOV73796.1 acyl-CoA dehydrogenase [Candidatus Hydrogenedentota bacterium]HPC18364.1 acyl-CoA dehydrogenase [Candidatus Hydrogenedentota bacterium]HRT22123.1 acyl-CoA dehydrogenase [Candidatus Hydrogenedentota bacterium]HRT66860.1 acyl-CoA dehydrogenase [Candidatus Hydrogenedentota bacterium]